MTQQELLNRTRTLMSQSGLVEGFGLGRTWAIISCCADWMAPYPQQRYSETRDRLRARWPDDVYELQALKTLPEFTWYLCLRLDSEAMQAFLSRSIGG